MTKFILVGLIFIFFKGNVVAETDCNNNKEELQIVSFFKKSIKDKIIKVTPNFCAGKVDPEALTGSDDDEFEKTMNFIIESNNRKYHSNYMSEPSKNVDIIKFIFLKKLWSELNREEQLEVFEEQDCSLFYYPYMLDFEYNTSNKKQEINRSKINNFTKICGVNQFEDMTKYLDKKTFVEFFYVLNQAGYNIRGLLDEFCNGSYGELLSSSPIAYHDDLTLKDFYNRMKFYKETEYMVDTEKIKERFDLGKVDKLTAGELEQIRNYSSDGYSNMNRCLRENKGKCSESETSESVAKVNQGLRKLNGKMKLSFRGTNHLPTNVLSSLYIGCVYQDHAFLSTSLDFSVARHFADNQYGYVFVIKGRSGGNISSISTLRGEAEILYPPNTKFIIKKITPKRTFVPQQIFLEEIEPGVKYNNPSYCK